MLVESILGSSVLKKPALYRCEKFIEFIPLHVPIIATIIKIMNNTNSDCIH